MLSRTCWRSLVLNVILLILVTGCIQIMIQKNLLLLSTQSTLTQRQWMKGTVLNLDDKYVNSINWHLHPWINCKWILLKGNLSVDVVTEIFNYFFLWRDEVSRKKSQTSIHFTAILTQQEKTKCSFHSRLLSILVQLYNA